MYLPNVKKYQQIVEFSLEPSKLFRLLLITKWNGSDNTDFRNLSEVVVFVFVKYYKYEQIVRKELENYLINNVFSNVIESNTKE